MPKSKEQELLYELYCEHCLGIVAHGLSYQARKEARIAHARETGHPTYAIIARPEAQDEDNNIQSAST